MSDNCVVGVLKHVYTVFSSQGQIIFTLPLLLKLPEQRV